MSIEDRAFARPVALFYGALFVVYGTHVPYMPVWLDWRGLTAAEISAVMAAPFFIRLVVTPFIAVIADRQGTHRRIITHLAWQGLVLVLVLAAMRSFWPILLLTVPLIVTNSTMMPLIETVAVQGMRHRGLDYGRMRLWGSLTFVGASFLGGLAIARYGSGSAIWLIATGCALTAIAAQALPRGEDTKPPRTEASVPIWKAREPRALLAEPAFRLFLAAAGLTMAAHATFLTFGTLLWQKHGMSGGWIGFLWAVGVAFEVMLFSMSGRLARRFGPARLIMFGGLFSVVRWAAMAAQPPLALLIPLQALHGVTYGATHIGAIHFIHHAVPRAASGTAQALYATVASGVAMGFATLIAGWLSAWGGDVSYMAMAVIAGLALAAALKLVATWRGETLLIATD